MKSNILFGVLLIAGIAVNSNVSAQATPAKRRIVVHERNQSKRIHEGVKSGELTHREAKTLRTDEKDLHQDTKMAKADGKVTVAERKDLRKEAKQDSRAIYRKKHNNRERP